MTSHKPLSTWRKLVVVGLFVLLVVPFFFAIFYPAITHTSPQAALLQVASYLDSPPVLIIFVLVLALGWAQAFKQIARRKAGDRGA